jgi:hypothetical protein
LGDAERGSRGEDHTKFAGKEAARRFNSASSNERPMKKTVLLGLAAGMAMVGAAKADPVDLSAYADANGFIDVQALTCGQLANTYQEDANALTSWYSG